MIPQYSLCTKTIIKNKIIGGVMHRAMAKGIKLSSVALLVAFLGVSAWFTQADEAVNQNTVVTNAE